MSKKLVHRKTTPKKKRDQVCYQHKVDRITSWYNHIIANHKETNPNGAPKKVLRPLSFYLEQIKGVSK